VSAYFDPQATGTEGTPEHSWSFWIIAVAAVVLNDWFDYYHT